MIANECNIDGGALRFERYSLILAFTNALLFSALFPIDTLSAYLVRAVFNGSGIIMVTGLVSLIFGNLYALAVSQPSNRTANGAYFASKALFFALGALLVVLMATATIKAAQ